MYDVTTTSPAALPSRTEHALATIKEGILSGRLAAGQPLVEAEIATELAMSKTPVREALKTLEMSGLVVVRPYVGVRVRELTQEDAVAIYETRLLLEPEATRRSVLRGMDTAAARAALERAARATEPAQRSLANRAFHAALWGASGNTILIGMLEGLRDQTALAAVTTWARQPSWGDEAQEHERILDAAETGDADLAGDLTRRHIAGFLDRLHQGGATD
ncbi:GntR family transcriptional regulator [Promicromonospora sp. NPDC050880]|uniref:GntR family transcriptional regulator n=1 Tax=Promicromonospora sp. NPDC050880 TaxID=3364406 RepID=UPI003793D517